MESDDLAETILFIFSERKRKISNDLRDYTAISISLFLGDLRDMFANLSLYPLLLYWKI